MATRILNWPRGLKIIIKITLMVLCCVGLCLIPKSMERYILRSFIMAGDALESADVVARTFYNTMSGWFIGFIALMFAVNLVFFIVDSIKNDTVQWRRSLQITLNIVILGLGLITGVYLVFGYYFYMAWWADVLFSKVFLNRLKWFPYLIFLAAGAFQMVWDIWLFGADNRNPWILRILRNEAMKVR